MSRTPKPPTRLQRAHRLLAFVLLVLAVALGILVSVGLGGLLALAALGVATFGGGPPKDGDGTYESRIGFPGGG